MSEVSPVVQRKTMAAILNLMAEHFDEKSRKELRDEYAMTGGPEEISGNKHSMITGTALNIVKTIIQKSGAVNEVHRALMYLAICMDTKKYHLDYRRAYKELMISHLMEKYGLKRPKKD